MLLKAPSKCHRHLGSEFKDKYVLLQLFPELSLCAQSLTGWQGEKEPAEHVRKWSFYSLPMVFSCGAACVCDYMCI